MRSLRSVNRRQFIGSMVAGSVLMPGILSEMLAQDAAAAPVKPGGPGASPALPDLLAPRPPHSPARAKRVIFLFATGGVSHIDTFDPKPQKDNKAGARGSMWGFGPNKRCGTVVSDLFPHLREKLDEVCVIRSMKSAHFDHSEAALGMHTGSASFARPSMGSWLSYGLGSLNRELPSFVVIAPQLPYGGTQVYASDFLPAHHQGTRVIPGESPVPNLLPRTPDSAVQEMELGLMDAFNRGHLRQRRNDSALAARIKSFETAFKMQQAGPEAFDVNQESDATLAMYGLKRGQTTGFGWQCLVARRLAERGVRFVELIDSGSNNQKAGNWDSHSDMKDHEVLARNVDQPMAALIADLKQRGMLEDTLVVWATEFGRTPRLEGRNGRGHHGDCFSVWLAGGGVKPGIVHGETDEIGSKITRDQVIVHDLHATILHLMGIDHTRLTYRHAGRDFRLTDVHGHLITNILA